MEPISNSRSRLLNIDWIVRRFDTMRAIILLAIVGSALALPEKQTRIVGGSSTSVARYPYMSNMQYGFLGIWWYQSCGGSLITTTSVLSAAHCYSGDSPSSWRVLLGTSLSSSGGTEYTVSKLIIHEKYNGKTLENDVAIVKLSKPAVLSSVVRTARIAGANYNLPDWTVVTAIGWGALSSGGSSPEQLQHVNINVINQQLCASRYASIRNVTSGMLCAGILNVGGKDACQGDSGGPLIHQGDIVVGITSWGYGCADAYYPGVNTRVSAQSNWIVNNA